MGSREVSSPPYRHLLGEEWGGGGGGCSASVGAGDLAATSLTGVGVAGSSCSQVSPVLADPSLVSSSVSAGRDLRSCFCKISESTGDRSHSCSSRSSPL